MCTSRAPASKTRRMRSRSCVPRTIESSQNRSRCPSMSSRMGISFIRATRSRTRCSCGMKERGHVGVYLTNGRRYGTPASAA